MVKNLKKLRTDAGLSQQKLAEIIGVSQQSVNKYENHSAEPDITTIIRLAEIFNTTTDYLLGFSDNNPLNFNTGELLRLFEKMTDSERKIFIEQGKILIKYNK